MSTRCWLVRIMIKSAQRLFNRLLKKGIQSTLGNQCSSTLNSVPAWNLFRLGFIHSGPNTLLNHRSTNLNQFLAPGIWIIYSSNWLSDRYLPTYISKCTHSWSNFEIFVSFRLVSDRRQDGMLDDIFFLFRSLSSSFFRCKLLLILVLKCVCTRLIVSRCTALTSVLLF